VVSHQKISSTTGGFDGVPINDGDFFGSAVTTHNIFAGIDVPVINPLFLYPGRGGTDLVFESKEPKAEVIFLDRQLTFAHRINRSFHYENDTWISINTFTTF